MVVIIVVSQNDYHAVLWRMTAQSNMALTGVLLNVSLYFVHKGNPLFIKILF